MGLVSKATQKISGVEKSRFAPLDSEVRQLLEDNALYDEDIEKQVRYDECSKCERLKEEFRLFGVRIKDMTPTCGECGCNLNIKIPMKSMSCPLGRW
jgi:hypothetical protein